VTAQPASLPALSLAVSSSGHPRVFASVEADDALAGTRAAAVRDAFERGAGAGVLHLGAVEVGTELPPPFAFYRDLGHELILRVCAHPDLETLRGRVHVEPPSDRLEQMASATPPMMGGEYVSASALAETWREAGEALRHEVATFRGPVAEWLHAKNGAWSTVGRVCFHLAENKRDPEAPFAFLATYTTRLSAKGAPQHRPLGHALEESSAKGDRERLLALLLPVQRAAEKSALVRGMVERGDVYHPLRWTPREAHAFLKEVPALETAGVIVRVPDWWSAKSPPRPQVNVTVGSRSPAQLGTDAVLDFSIQVALGGELLSAEERRAILQATDGLVFLKGRWVEADGARLREVLAHWKQVEQAATRDGVSFHEAMRLLAGGPLEGDMAGGAPEQVRGWSRAEPGPWMKAVLDGLRAPDSLAPIDTGVDLRASLRPYQRVGVQWLWWAHELGLGVCLADDMGLGKTLQVLALLLLRRSRRRPPALLVVPASLVANWKAEAERFCPTLHIVVAHAASTGASALAAIESEDVDAADAVLTTYGALTRVPWLLEREWGLVVLDEAQAIKNPGARQTRTVKSLRGKTRIALTGTPVENRLGDLWSLFDFLAPGLLGSAKQFGTATKRMAKAESDGYAPLRSLVRPYILRRLKTDKRVIDDLPDKTEVTAYCGLTRVQAALYQRAVDDLSRALDSREGIERKGAILAALMRFKQICNHPSHWLGDGVWDPEASGKLSRLREICEPIAARQEKAIVFTQFREMTAPLAGFLRRVFGREGLVLHGSVPVKQRKGLVDAFQDEAGPPFFVLSLKAGGTGLNLTAASHVLHFDRWWNPAVENQATDRAFRIGQKKNVLVHKFVCRGTVEERIDALITSKRALAEAVVEGGAEERLTELSNEELLRMVSLDLGSALGNDSDDS
jgi:SNF2 domain-containing protein/SNF2 helicase protein/helicase-like protein